MFEAIGRFHVRKRLGGGGFGEVFLAEDPTIGRQVAIKVFRPRDENLIAFATSSNTEGLDILRTRFLNEAKILARLENAVHVVNVLEYGELPDGAPYYVMPFLPHSLADELGKDVFDVKTLADLPADQRPRALPLQRVLQIGEQMLKGLAAAHGMGLVHRDIKPANVMLTEDGDVRIVDFGIAKAPDGQHSTVSHLGMGSRNYMAPEQRESAKHVDARADVYAVGRVLYRMLTGRLPVGRFADPNVAVPALGKAMNEVILAAISEDREARPANAAALLQGFQPAKASVGEQDRSEHSGTWAGEQGESALRDELQPLKAKITHLVSEMGLISARDLKALQAMAAMGDLDHAGLTQLINQTVNENKALQAKHKLGQLIATQVRQQGQPLNDEELSVYADAAAGVGWDAAQLARAMQVSVVDLPRAESGARQEVEPGETGSKADIRHAQGSPARLHEVQSSKQVQLEATNSRRWPLAALIAVLLLVGSGFGVYAWRQAQIAAEQLERGRACERLAASPDDPQRPADIPGVPIDKVDGAGAVLACGEIAQTSTDPRLWYLYGRALYANNDESEAVHWFRQAAEAGNPLGMSNLGYMYAQGSGVAKDAAEGVHWYRQAAEAGIPQGMTNLGLMYMQGLGVAKDEAEAVRWYRRAAEAGYPQGMTNLGVMYAQGLGVAKDEAEAVRWYRQAAEVGDPQGMTNLGVMYAQGLGVAKDEAEAARWYRRAAEAGNPQGMTNLGYVYEQGHGVAKDEAEAVRWYRQAAEAGHPPGMTNLGFMYAQGQGVAKDAAEAVRWYRRAAEAGSPQGMTNLGFMYAQGHGVAKDDVEAVRWFQMAAADGHEAARQELQRRGLTSLPERR